MLPVMIRLLKQRGRRHVRLFLWGFVGGMLLYLTLSLMFPPEDVAPAVQYGEFPAPPAGALPDPAEWRSLTAQEISNLSRVGRMLFLNDRRMLQPQAKTFTILIWELGKDPDKRYIKRLVRSVNYLGQDCSVSNCEYRYSKEEIMNADAVVFRLYRTLRRNSLPLRGKLNEKQIWIFLTDDNPKFLFTGSNNIKYFSGIFNWSMTYKIDSDVPVPYGRTVPLTRSEAKIARIAAPRNYARHKPEIAAMFMSDCSDSNELSRYLLELQKYIRVDIYGECGNYKFNENDEKNNTVFQKYKFYLAFENSECRDYITEKVWWYAYRNGLVPVVMGISRENCKHHLPPGSYLHVDDFANPAELASTLIVLNNSDFGYNTYFKWKYQYKILNEHGYFRTPIYHYCRLCEALNYNSPSSKIYSNIERFWNC